MLRSPFSLLLVTALLAASACDEAAGSGPDGSAVNEARDAGVADVASPADRVGVDQTQVDRRDGVPDLRVMVPDGVDQTQVDRRDGAPDLRVMVPDAAPDAVRAEMGDAAPDAAPDAVRAEVGDAARCSLTASGPVTVTANGQTVERLRITASGKTGITVRGFSNVTIRNVEILHTGGQGIVLENAPGARIENVVVTHTGAPSAGANSSADLNNVLINGSSGVTVDGARLERGSSGIHLFQSPGSVLRNIEGHDFRGPLPRGQLVQWDASDDGLLEYFSVINPPDTAWTEDNVNVYKSLRVTIRQGLIDGNNSPTGCGVMFDGGTGSGRVEDVDAIHMTVACFSNFAGADGNVFRRTRCRDNICTGQQGRGPSLSNPLMWCGTPKATSIRLEDSTYFNPCFPNNVLWPADSFAIAEARHADFVPRAPLTLRMCWE